MVTRASKLRQSVDVSSNGSDQNVHELEEVQDEVIKEDDEDHKFKIIESITTTISGSAAQSSILNKTVPPVAGTMLR